MPQAKKKATAKAVKPKSSGTRKSPIAKPAGRTAADSSVKSPVASKKPANKKAGGNQATSKKASKKEMTVKKMSKKTAVKKPTPKKANTNPNSVATSRKIAADKAVEAPIKPAMAKKANERASLGPAPVAKMSVEKPKPVNKEEENISKPKASKDSPESGKGKFAGANPDQKLSERKAGSNKQAESGLPSKAKTRKQDSGLSGFANQGQVKPGQKKRGWRDIEALTERARLKSLLSDIWHEDIDLDSDIFGEADHLFGYYTDKEDVVEVEPEVAEEWEEFEEEED